MKNNTISSFILFSFLCVFCFQKTNAQVGIGNTEPRPGAILDIENNEGNQGILIPRVNLEDLQTTAPISNPTESLLVFNTNTNTGEGFYYWDGSNWIEVGSRESNTGMQFYTYDYNPMELRDCNLYLFGCWSWGPYYEGWENPPVIPNEMAPRTEDKSGSYTGILNINQSNFAASGLMSNSSDTFIIKLVGYYDVEQAGDFRINSSSNGGVRLYIDEALVVNKWTDNSTSGTYGKVFLAKGKHKFEFWYYDNVGSESFTFVWGPNADGNTGNLKANQFTLN